MCLTLMMPSPRNDLKLRGGYVNRKLVSRSEKRFLMALRVSGLPLWVNFQQVGREKNRRGGWNKCRDIAGSHLTRHGVFTEESIVVYGKDRGIIIDIQHCDERDAFSNLGWVLWKRRGREESPLLISQHPACFLWNYDTKICLNLFLTFHWRTCWN